MLLGRAPRFVAVDCRLFLSRRRPNNASSVPTTPAVHQPALLFESRCFSDVRRDSAVTEREGRAANHRPWVSRRAWLLPRREKRSSSTMTVSRSWLRLRRFFGPSPSRASAPCHRPRMMQQKQSSSRRPTPARTPITMPAIAPPLRLEALVVDTVVPFPELVEVALSRVPVAVVVDPVPVTL